MDSTDLLAFTPHRSVVDGVPVYSMDDTTIQPAIALTFRVGRVDERVEQRGVTHLVEHLSLHEFHGAPYFFNGQVGGTTTVFAATGDAEQVVTFARDLCRNLKNLPLARMRREVQVLVTESQDHLPALQSHLLSIHCGYTRYGSMAMPELGLAKVREADVRAWAAAMFTRENLAVWIAGVAPEALTFDLPSGSRVPVPEPTQIPSLQPPIFVTKEIGGVGLSALTEWSLPLKVAAMACQHRLHERLRVREGLSYAALGHVDRLTSRMGHVFVGSDCVATAADQTTAALLETVSAIATDGHTPDDLRHGLSATRRTYATHSNVSEILNQWVHAELVGFEQGTISAELDSMEAVGPRDVAAALRQVMDAALLIVPAGCEPTGGRFRRYSGPTASVLRGRTFYKQPAFLTFRARVNYIAVNTEGVTYVDDQGKPTTIYFSRCAGMLKGTDGKRVLLGEDAQSIAFTPSDWPDGQEIGSLLDAAVPDEQIIWCLP